MKMKARFGGLFVAALACVATTQPLAQDVASGRELYVANCARCHADPPGSGFVNPPVRTADEIVGAINRVSPMGFLGSVLNYTQLQAIAAYFSSVLGEPTNTPDYSVSDVWWNPNESGWGLVLRQHTGRRFISGSWYTYDGEGKPTWFIFDNGSWTGPAIYTAKLYRVSGSPFSAQFDTNAVRTTEAGTAALVFSNRDLADITLVVDGVRLTKKISRFPYPR